ncbi:Beta-barrel assembly machine subunit BamC [Thiogranum longum]|uniref:Beta-barrel assembly machine subunit BamC n=1 Tax=Thiogranum longum TaxID=1537524 RepID=A0A4R1H6N0_9GAMM|nr:outer membrane protein assembly factor BamC [Thiogranum longum]TCK17417.1 Beta-barrel assembly machine subunit BamC [Thiogranum longum]
MPENFIALRILLPVLLLSGLSGCGTLDRMFPDRSGDYKKTQTESALDVPPDLTSTPVNDALVVHDGAATLSGYNSATQTRKSASGQVLPTPEDMSIERDKDRAWLVIKGDPATVWNRARQFWLDSGFLISRENPELGVLETDWVDSQVNAPGDIIRNTISRVFQSAYSSSLRDRYRMRLESGEKPGTTEIYITHKGLQEKLEGRTDEIQTTVWEPRPSDPGLESEMLKQMMVYLGATPQRAEQLLSSQQPAPDKAELTKLGDGQPVLVLHDSFPQAWRRVGITLDRIDFAVEDRDRSAGTYFVRYNDPLKQQKKGFLSKLAFWSDDETDKVTTYQIKLVDDGADTRVMVLNEKGEAETTVTPVRILTLLYEELR